MKIKWKWLMKLVFLATLLLFVPIVGLAEEEEDLIKQVGFSYTINHPSNQLGDGGALNLKMTPNQKQQVTATIKNTNDQDITILLSLNGARTNGHGGLEYGPNEFKKDKSMAYDLTDLVTIPKEITIPKNAEKDIVLDIKMPAVPFEGIVTGGVQMIEKEGKKEAPKETGIVNKVAYLFGVTLQFSEDELEPNLDLYKAYPGLENFRNAVFLDIANIIPMKLTDLMVHVEITNEGKDDVLYESKKNNMEMAPNTLMAYPVMLDGEKMIAGKYTAHVLATAHDKEWRWDKNFTITREDADLFNQKDVNLVQERGLDWKLVALIVGILVFVIVAIYFVRRYLVKKNKKKKQGKQEKRRRKKEK